MGSVCAPETSLNCKGPQKKSVSPSPPENTDLIVMVCLSLWVKESDFSGVASTDSNRLPATSSARN